MNPIKINSTSRSSVIYHLSAYIMDQFIMDNKVPLSYKPIKDINDMIDNPEKYIIDLEYLTKSENKVYIMSIDINSNYKRIILVITKSSVFASLESFKKLYEARQLAAQQLAVQQLETRQLEAQQKDKALIDSITMSERVPYIISNEWTNNVGGVFTIPYIEVNEYQDKSGNINPQIIQGIREANNRNQFPKEVIAKITNNGKTESRLYYYKGSRKNKKPYRKSIKSIKRKSKNQKRKP